MREEMVAGEQRKPQPQDPIVRKRELHDDVDQPFGRKLKLELIPVARHRPFGRENKPQARIGMDDAHGRALASPDFVRGNEPKPGRRRKFVWHHKPFRKTAIEIPEGAG